MVFRRLRCTVVFVGILGERCVGVIAEATARTPRASRPVPASKVGLQGTKVRVNLEKHSSMAVILSSPCCCSGTARARTKDIMSFGVGISDIIGALQFAKATFDSWKDAPTRYIAIKDRLQSLQGPLHRLDYQLGLLEREATKRELAYWREEVAITFRPVAQTLVDLEEIVDRRGSLGTDKRNFWDRLRLGTRRVSELGNSLDRHISDLTFLCTELGLENDRKLSAGQDAIRRNQRDLQEGQNEILRLVSEILPTKVPMATVEVVADTMESVSMSSSFTEYGSDDPEVWREFRRQAIAEGITSKELERYEPELLEVLHTVVQKRKKGRKRRRARSHGGGPGIDWVSRDDVVSDRGRERPRQVDLLSDVQHGTSYEQGRTSRATPVPPDRDRASSRSTITTTRTRYYY